MADRHATKLTLPKGKAVYPFLNSPDYQFDELGVYQTRLSVPVEEAKPIMDKISSFFEDYAGKKLNPSDNPQTCLLYTSPSPRDGLLSRMPSSA